MCLAIPMKITQIDGVMAVAEVSGVTRSVRLDVMPDIAVGDYVLVHAGLAIAKVDEDEARETLELLRGLTDEV